MATNEKIPEKCQIFLCKKCNFECSKNSNYQKHLMTRKHKILTNPNAGLTKNAADKSFTCGCGKVYKHMSSLCNHKKKCLVTENKPTVLTECDLSLQPKNDLVLTLLNQNMELQKQIIELCKEKNTVINNTTNNTTNNNNSFNLNLFLNEQCKDALNIMDFINQLQVKLSDLDMVGRVGYAEGISKIFIRGLKELDVFKRPIHCSDFKRETLYVKDKDLWEKDTDEKEKLKLAIKHISAKNAKNIPAWVEENPDSEDYESKKHMEYHNIVINAMGGSTDEEDEKLYNKIIKNVSKEVTINKEKQDF
jgi:hypothetical protein